MPIPTRETLKAYFETADVPTEAQFAALIDAIYDLAQSAQDTADAAEALVENYSTRVGSIYGAVTITYAGSSIPTPIHLHGCTVGYTGGGVGAVLNLTFTFDDVLPSDEYVCLFSCEKFSPYVANAQQVIITRNAGSVVFVIPASAGVGQSWEFHFAIFLP